MTNSLYPFQVDGVKFLSSRLSALLADEQGLGKSIEAISAINRIMPARVLIVCKAGLKKNWEYELSKWLHNKKMRVQVLNGGADELDILTDIVIVNYDLLAISDNIYSQVCFRRYDVGVFDECFHRDTKIETDAGIKNIVDIKVDDKIRNCLGWDKVTGVKLKKLDQYIKIRYNNQDIKVSTNHLFFTASGWKKAIDLRKGDCLVQTHSSEKILSDMQKINNQIYETETTVLQSELFCEMENATTRNKKETLHPSSKRENKIDAGQIMAVGISGEKTESGFLVAQFDERTRSKAYRQNKKDVETDKMETDCTRRQRTLLANTTKQIAEIGGEDVGSRICDFFGKASERVSDLLSCRYGLSLKKNSDRDRRNVTFRNKETGRRQKEGKEVEFFRVENISLHEFPSDERSGFDTATNIFVDLEIENHPSFDVNGVLVHNCHMLKGRTSKRTKAILSRGGIASKCFYKWFMTGTPVLNRPEELYPLLKAAAPEVIAPYTTFETFATHFCSAWWDGFQLVTKGASNTLELHKRLLDSGFMLRRLKKDVLPQLPDKSYQIVTVEPQSKEVKELIAKEFTWSKTDAKKVQGVTGGEQIAIVRHSLALSKVDKAAAHIEDLLLENNKLVVFAYHRDVIQMLIDKLKHYGVVSITGATMAKNRQDIVKDFQENPKTHIFIGQYQAAGDGITLTAASTVVFVESSWVPGEISQATDRLHRIGQKDAVLVQFLVIEGSLEESMLRTMIDKKEIISQIVENKPEEK